MTQEQKAKAYDEALKRAKRFHTPDSNNSNLKAVLERIFPELVEIEDERIRGCIGIILTDATEQRFTDFGVSLKDCLTWLEKQRYDRMKPIYDARESFESALEKAWNDYHNGYENVDKLEDDYVKCAYAKGFREGYLFGIEKPISQSEDVFKIWGTTEKEYLENSMDKVHLEMEISTYLKDWEDDEEIGLHLSTDNGCIPIELEDVRDLARHFYELGFNARKEE